MVMQDSYDSSTIHFLNSYQFMVIARLNPPASLTFPGGRSEDEADEELATALRVDLSAPVSSRRRPGISTIGKHE